MRRNFHTIIIGDSNQFIGGWVYHNRPRERFQEDSQVLIIFHEHIIIDSDIRTVTGIN